MPEVTLEQLEALRESFVDSAKDIRINLANVLNSETLSKEQSWGVAVASACYLAEPRLLEAVVADARSNAVPDEIIRDAQAAAALMAMNTVYYRFRHMIAKESYSQMKARLRMQWMLNPLTGKANFELFCMAVAALAGCEMCIKSHEASLLQHGLTEDHVHDAVRIAAVLNGAVVAMGLGK